MDPCRYVAVPDGTRGHTAPPGEQLYIQLCPGETAGAITSLPAGDRGVGGPVIDPLALAQQAANELVLPAPAMRMNPPGDQVVQLPSWLWIDQGQWQSASASASAGAVTSTVTGRPRRVVWDMGNGDQVVCDGPGRPYHRAYAYRPEATDCKYTYRHSSAGQPNESYRVTATVEWALTWTAQGAPGGGSLGTVRRSATVPVRVTELQALVQ